MESNAATLERANHIRVRVNVDDLMQLPRGERIRILRVIQGINPRQLADLIGVSRATIYDWEKGNWNPTDDNVWRAARALGVPVYVLATPPPPNIEESDEGQEA